VVARRRGEIVSTTAHGRSQRKPLDDDSTTTKALGTLSNATPAATTDTTKALGTLSNATPAATTDTTKALGPLAAAEQDTLGARCRSRLG
jgi:hypothetical protein